MKSKWLKRHYYVKTVVQIHPTFKVVAKFSKYKVSCIVRYINKSINKDSNSIYKLASVSSNLMRMGSNPITVATYDRLKLCLDL